MKRRCPGRSVAYGSALHAPRPSTAGAASAGAGCWHSRSCQRTRRWSSRAGVIGKPLNAADAAHILGRLSGRTHRVLTAVAICLDTRIETALSISEVRFATLSDADIRRYVDSGEPMDKAGAYGIQGRAGIFVEHLAGSYTGVMGLPLHETAVLLRRFGYIRSEQGRQPPGHHASTVGNGSSSRPGHSSCKTACRSPAANCATDSSAQTASVCNQSIRASCSGQSSRRK